jgi:hypothetical protein
MSDCSTCGHSTHSERTCRFIFSKTVRDDVGIFHRPSGIVTEIITGTCACETGKHGPDCEGPDEDGDWLCPSDSREPGFCLNCLHNHNIWREMQPSVDGTMPGWFICYTCYHAC